MAKQKNNLLLWILLGITAILIALAVYKAQSKPKGEKVSVQKVVRRTVQEIVPATGKIYPETEIKISSDVSGEVVELFVAEGDTVKKGDILANIDPDAIESQVERSEASVNNSKALVANAKAQVERMKGLALQSAAQAEQIEAQLKNQRLIHQRNEKLLADGVISQADFDNSLASLDALVANLKSSKAAQAAAEANHQSAIQTAKANEFQVKSAEAALKEVQTNLKRTTIYAPADGIISQLNVEKGERVVGTSMMTGTELMRVADLSAIEVQVDVSENDILRVSLNNEAKIEVDAYQDKVFTGRVTQIANSATTSIASTDQVINFVVKIRLDPESYTPLIKKHKRFPFRPGMSATVDIATNKVENTLVVPIQSVTTRSLNEDKNTKNENNELEEVVFLISGDSVSTQVVSTGIQDDEYIQILSGLSEDQEVVSAPYTAISKELENGSSVRIVEEKELYKRGDK